jgi:hypothetical protein
VPTRPLILVGLTALALAGCSGAAGSGSAGDATSAAAGAAAAYAPADSLVYIHADKRVTGWQAMQPLRTSLALNQQAGDSLGTLAQAMSGLLLEPQKEIRPALIGESAFMITSNAPGTRATDPRVWRFLTYDTVTDRPAIERWLPKEFRQIGNAGDFALWAPLQGGEFVMALSDHVLLGASTTPDLRAAIARGAGGKDSLADDPDFVAALARDHDTDAVVRGYSRDDLVAAFDSNSWGGRDSVGLQGLTRALGLAKTAFDAGPAELGIWIHAHPASTPEGYPAATPFEPTLLKRVPYGTIAYVGLNDMGAQLPQLARLVDLAHDAVGSTQTGQSVPGWFSGLIGVGVDQMAPFLHGEQAWWWGPSLGAAFRPDETDTAYGTAQQVSRNYTAKHGPDQKMVAARDGDVVSVRTVVEPDPESPPPPDPDSTLGGDPEFTALLAHAALPEKVSVLVYADPRPFRSSPAADDQSERTTADTFGRLLLWTAPADGGYDLSVYAELNPSSG